MYNLPILIKTYGKLSLLSILFLIYRMDKDETLKINYDEFREYLLLHPSSNIWDIVHYWRHASVSLF